MLLNLLAVNSEDVFRNVPLSNPGVSGRLGAPRSFEVQLTRVF
jgi:hypothetical protein